MPGISSAAIMAKPNTVAETLRGAVLWLDARDSVAGEQAVVNKGTGGTVLNAQYGSAAGAEANDPLFLPHAGTNYLYVPNTVSNLALVPDSNSLDIAGDIDISVITAQDDWTPGVLTGFISKWANAPQLSFFFGISAANTLILYISSTGSDSPSVTSSVAMTAADGTNLGVRVTRVQSTGLVTFYTSTNSGASWVQLGSTQTLMAGSSIFAGTEIVRIGGNATYVGPGKYYRATIRDGIGGTAVLDVDFTANTQQSSFVCTTGQTVTLNRSTLGRKLVVVTRPVWLFGTDDYMQVADNDLLDFAADESFTVMAVLRQWDYSTNQYILSKKNHETPTEAGWALQFRLVNGYVGRTADGTNSTFAGWRNLPEIPSPGTAYPITYRKDGVMRNVRTYSGEMSGAAVTDSTLGSISNSQPLKIGSLGSVGAYANMECFSVLVWRRALSASEIAAVSTYLTAGII